jgi:hypothetical protein
MTELNQQLEVEYYDPDANWDLIPPHMQEGVHNYVMHGVPFGGFLTAVFSNDLMGAAVKTDDKNLARLADWTRFLYNYVPSRSYGSPERVAAWIESGGVVGQRKARETGL